MYFGQSYVPILKTFLLLFYYRKFEDVDAPEGHQKVPRPSCLRRRGGKRGRVPCNDRWSVSPEPAVQSRTNLLQRSALKIYLMPRNHGRPHTPAACEGGPGQLLELNCLKSSGGIGAGGETGGEPAGPGGTRSVPSGLRPFAAMWMRSNSMHHILQNSSTEFLAVWVIEDLEGFSFDLQRSSFSLSPLSCLGDT